MNIPMRISYTGGSYRPFSHIGTTGNARVYRFLHVPMAATSIKNDYPANAHRIIKALPQIQKNVEAYDVLREDHRNTVFSHRNLMKVERSFIHDETSYVISIENMSGTIHDLIKSGANFLGNGVPEKTFCFILKQVLEGLNYIHSIGHTYQTLDTWSIFYSTTKSPAIKLNVWAANFDMGVLRKSDTMLTSKRRTTKKVRCPERRGETPHAYTSMSDMWHLGLIAIEMSIGELERTTNARADYFIKRFHVASQQPVTPNVISSSTTTPNMQTSGRVMRGNISVPIRTDIPGQVEEFRTHYFSPEFVDFVVKCTHHLPQERTEATSLLSHAFFQRYLSSEHDFQTSLNEEALL